MAFAGLFPFRLTITEKCGKAAGVFEVYLLAPQDEMTEELVDNGYAVGNVCSLRRSAPDRPEAVTEGIAGIIEQVPYLGWGKIAMWAYGLSRITDYLMTRTDIDRERIAISWDIPDWGKQPFYAVLWIIGIP